MLNLPRSRRLGVTFALAAATLTTAALTGCSSPTPGGQASPGAGVNKTAGAPVTIQNCGHEVTITHKPERIVVVNNDTLGNLEALDAINRVVAVTSTPDPGLYSESTYAHLKALPSLSTRKNATGGSIVSQESLLGQRPDLVVAPENAVNRDALQAVGIPVFSPSAYCNTPPAAASTTATFDRVWTELTEFGALIGEADKAAQVISEAKSTLGATPAATNTAAAVYVSSGGTVISPYGGPSMVTQVFAAAGLSNVYADARERVFDVNVEDLASRNPQTVVVLYSGTDEKQAVEAFTSAPGVKDMAAVKNHRVIGLRFPFTDPPSVLSVRGPAELSRQLASLR